MLSTGTGSGPLIGFPKGTPRLGEERDSVRRSGADGGEGLAVSETAGDWLSGRRGTLHRRMGESSRGLTHGRLLWTAEWHVRDETYAATLSAIVDPHYAHPMSTIWGPGDTSSSDRQFFRAGGKCEACADLNARHGSEPGVLFYTHVSDRFAPFHTKVIAANAGEAAHVIEGFLDHESGIALREHATDTAGAVDHVFGLCHLLGFRFAPGIRDLGERRLYSLGDLSPFLSLRPLVAGPVSIRTIEENGDEVIRLAASIRAGTVPASAMLRKMSRDPRQNSVARDWAR